MTDSSDVVFNRLAEMVDGINAALKVLQPLQTEIEVSTRYDVFGRCLVVLHCDEGQLTKEMTLGELMDWIEGAFWAVGVITGSYKGELRG